MLTKSQFPFFGQLQNYTLDWPQNLQLTVDQNAFGQFTVDRTHYWPKVHNIFCTYLSIQNVHFLLLWDFFARNLPEKVSHNVQGSKISWISNHQGSQCVMSCLKGDFFIRSIQCLQFGFSKFSYIFTHIKRTFILNILDRQNVPL